MQLRPSELLKWMFNAAVSAAQASECLSSYLPEPPKGRTLVIGAGKASAAMAQALEAHWSIPLEGLVVTRYGYAVPCQHIEIIEAAHPVPDAAGQIAAQRIYDSVQQLTQDDLVIFLISGGGSSLLSMPAPGLTLEDKQTVTAELLKSGATIAELNTVRKHLSAIKGGRLAAVAAPAQIVNLLISDVPGDDPTLIASGPSVADPSTYEQAREILQRYAVTVPVNVTKHLQREEDETPKPGDKNLAHVQTHIIATPQKSLLAAAAVAEEQGYQVMILGDSLEGEARDVAQVHAGIVAQILRYEQPLKAPCILLSGGETTVTVRGNGSGRGGRNAEFALALAKALKGHAQVYAIACDTDGIDGTEDNAGALVTPSTLRRAKEQGMSIDDYLENHDSYHFFKQLNNLVVTGPTMTNVNDFRAILITE